MKVLSGRRSPEYSRAVKIGSGLVIINLALSGCVARASANSDNDPTPSRPRVTETFSPTLTTEVILGPSPDINRIAAFGRAVGAGGQNPIEPTYGTNTLISKLFDSGLQPIVDGGRKSSRGENLLTQTAALPDGSRMCFPNAPVVLFNPGVASGQDDLIRDANFIRYYGNGATGEVRFQTVEAITLEKLKNNIVCVNAIARADRANIFNAQAGTVITVLMDKDTAEIYGGYRSVFGAEEKVAIDQATGRVSVNGRSVWFEGPGMAKLTEQLIVPGSVSAEKLLAECPVKLEVKSNLQGKVAVNGEIVMLNYPDLATNITIALHSDILSRGGETYLPQYDKVYLNPNVESATGISPARQLVADLWFGHYSAWQHDQDDRFFEQRKNTTFTGYLYMVSKGGDGSHMLWVKTTQNGIYPQTEKRIDPRTMNLVVIYYNDLRGFGGNLARSPGYEEFNNTLIWPLGLTYAGGPPYSPDYWLVKYYGYRGYSESFTHLSANSDLQKYGYGSDMSSNPQISRERYLRSKVNLEQIRSAYIANQFEVFPQNYPLEMHSSGFK